MRLKRAVDTKKKTPPTLNCALYLRSFPKRERLWCDEREWGGPVTTGPERRPPLGAKGVHIMANQGPRKAGSVESADPHPKIWSSRSEIAYGALCCVLTSAFINSI